LNSADVDIPSASVEHNDTNATQAKNASLRGSLHPELAENFDGEATMTFLDT